MIDPANEDEAPDAPLDEPIPSDADDGASEPADATDSDEAGASSASTIEPASPPSEVRVTPADNAATDLLRSMHEMASSVFSGLEPPRPEGLVELPDFQMPGARSPDTAGNSADKTTPERHTYDLLYRSGKDNGPRGQKLPYIHPAPGEKRPLAPALLSDANTDSPSPAAEDTPTPGSVSDGPDDTPQAPLDDAPSSPPNIAPPSTSRSIRLPFSREPHDEPPSTLRGLVDLHERQTAAHADGSKTPPVAAPANDSSTSDDPTSPDESASPLPDDPQLHTLPQVIVTVNLLDAERLVSEEFRSLADEHTEAMRQIATEELDEYNFKLIAELRAVMGR